jgi:hypothetical protein
MGLLVLLLILLNRLHQPANTIGIIDGVLRGLIGIWLHNMNLMGPGPLGEYPLV